MSWIFSFLLLCYASIRLVLWTRGQWRWLAIRGSLPQPPAEVPAPERLSPGLALLFLRSRKLRVQLTHTRRMLAAVAATDPDIPLGQVRDSRYRRALMESWTFIRVWIRDTEAMSEADGLVLSDMGSNARRTIAELAAGLRDPWNAVARSRALDPFPLADLARVRAILDAVERELVELEDCLASFGEDPYRERHGWTAGSDHAVVLH